MAPPGWAELYGWQLDRATGTPLFRQIYLQVRAGVLTGVLAPGTKLPSTRAMASTLGAARASVVAAYELLLAEGYVAGRAGSGTFVSDDLSGRVVPVVRRRAAARPAKRQPAPAPAQIYTALGRS